MRKFTFIWFIENYSYCWHNKGEEIVSPTFFVDILQQTSYNVLLYPKGQFDSSTFGLLLLKRRQCSDPTEMDLNFELDAFSSKGTFKFSNMVSEVDEFGASRIFEPPENLLGQTDDVSTSDILKVRCKMWIGQGKVDKETLCFARTKIGLEKISFLNVIKNFSDIIPNQEMLFHASSATKDGILLSGYVIVNREPGAEEEVIVKVFSNPENIHLITCQLYLLDSEGKETECGKMDTRNDMGRNRTLNFPIKFGTKGLLGSKLEYLPNDALTFRCECTLSTGIEFAKIENTYHDLHLTPFLRESLHGSDFVLSPEDPKSILNDFRSLYKDKVLSDLELKTVNKTFPAHKCVLSARSIVFKVMLTTDMKEKMTDCIEIQDLDEDTIDQFLVFLYTDVLENLQWESALKLYYAADKYHIRRLKDICSSFLIKNLNASNIIDVLILSDRHEDSILKTAVENAIWEYGNRLFCTKKWESFMETNPQLAMKTMHFFLINKRLVII